MYKETGKCRKGKFLEGKSDLNGVDVCCILCQYINMTFKSRKFSDLQPPFMAESR